MDQSPLTLQWRPDVFEPKVVQLYRELFQDSEEDEKSDGFWQELFLLKPDIAQFGQILEGIDPEHLLDISHISQQFFVNAIAVIKARSSPQDQHALETLSLYLSKVLSKRYQSPSSDIIEVLSGLDNVDAVFNDLVEALEGELTYGKNAISVTSGAFNTSLLTYFTQRDLFPSMMSLIQQAPQPVDGILPLILCGILCNCNKFELRNPYQARLAALSSDDIITSLVTTTGAVCSQLRDRYIVIQDDGIQGWSIGGTLSYVGLGSLAGMKSPTTPTEDQAKAMLAEQPYFDAAALLALYDLVLGSKQFITRLTDHGTNKEAPSTGLSEFLSFSSYLLQHAHRSLRAALYSHLVLLIIRILSEDPVALKQMTGNEAEARLCRHRPPFLPHTKGPRPYTAIVLDVATDCMNHNLRTRLDINIYHTTIGIMIRVIAYLIKTRVRIQHHWAELWRSLLSFVRFLGQYRQSLLTFSGIDEVVHDLVNLITLCLTQGENFLPDTKSLDDLMYQIVGSHSALERLRDGYELATSPVAGNIDTLLGASLHFTAAFDAAGGNTKRMYPKDVMKAIKEGYETLSLEAREGTDRWTVFREQDHKAEIKKITRMAIADARELAISAL